MTVLLGLLIAGVAGYATGAITVALARRYIESRDSAQPTSLRSPDGQR